MAGFELSRIGTVGEVAREWRMGRYLPLYLAGIVLGVAFGVALTLDRGGATATLETERSPHRATIAEAPAPYVPAWSIAPSYAAAAEAPAEDAHVVLQPETLFVAAPTVPVPAPQAAAEAPVVAPVMPVAPAVTVPVAAQPAPAPVPVPVQESAPVAPPAPPAPASDFYVPSVASGGPSGLEQRLFDGLNAERAKAGLAPYSYDAGLTKIARTRSQQMADQGYFGHVDPAGYSMYVALLKHFGYTSYAWAGENLAMNNYNVTESAERSVISLMNSPTHRANILAGDFFRIGIGEVTTADGRHIFTMIFLG